MPKAPNYAQDRNNRARAQAAKAQEKADRRAEESAKRKALKDAEPEKKDGGGAAS
jgi:hypothetical protein